MLRKDIEQGAKEKVLSELRKVPEFTHPFFIQNESISFTTKRSYFGIFQHFLTYIKDIYKLQDIMSITPNILSDLKIEDIETYKSTLSKDFAESTINSKLNSIKGIFKFLYRNHIIQTNVMSQIIINNNIDNNNDNKVKIDAINALFESLYKINNELLRKRNLSIVSLIIDTGLSVQDIIELNISNIVNNQVVYYNEDNIITYVLEEKTISFLNDYMYMIDTNDINQPLYKSNQKERISSTAIKNIFNQYGNGITPSNFQAKPYVVIKDTHNYTLTIRHKSQ